MTVLERPTATPVCPSERDSTPTQVFGLDADRQHSPGGVADAALALPRLSGSGPVVDAGHPVV